MNDPVAWAYKIHIIYLQNKNGIPTILGYKEDRQPDNTFANIGYHYILPK